MLIQKISLAISICALPVFLMGCANNSDTMADFEEGLLGSTMTPTHQKGTPLLVHVDVIERIVTIRNGKLFGNKFLVAKNRDGVETAVLKTDLRAAKGELLIADILEGRPAVGNGVYPASQSRSRELAKIYSDPETVIE